MGYAQNSQGKFPGIQRLVTALHGVFALVSQRESKLQSNPCTTTTLKKWQQRAKKVLSDSPGLVDFAIGLVNSVFNLPDGQVMFYEEFE